MLFCSALQADRQAGRAGSTHLSCNMRINNVLIFSIPLFFSLIYFFGFSNGIETFNLIKQTLDYSVNSWNPAFMDKLYASTDPIGVISELLLGVLNGNAHVYHVSPVLTLMEIHVTKATAKLLGMGEKAGGLFCPGGSASNLLAMVTARNRMFPSIKKSGYFPRPMNPAAEYGKLKVFTSTHSHYSIDKAAMVLGLGSENIVKVPADAHGRMLVPELGK